MYLVTGGAGFIGSNIVAALTADGHEVMVCDWLGQDDKWRNLAKHPIAGIIPPERLDAFLAGNPPLQAIVHMGAISETTARDGDLTFHTNVTLSLRLWNWCADRGVRFIYASSAATYGDGAHGFTDDASAEALAKLRPLNLYGWTKHAFDRRVATMLAHGYKAPPQWAGLKFFNVYGPNEYHKGPMISVVKVKLDEIRRGEKARLFRSDTPGIADGEQKRDFVHVNDCVSVVRFLLGRPDVSGLFNVGTGAARSFRDMVNAIYTALDRAPDIEFIDMPEKLRGQYQSFTQADMARLRQAGWNGQSTPLEDGVRSYVRDYLLNPDPYR